MPAGIDLRLRRPGSDRDPAADPHRQRSAELVKTLAVCHDFDGTITANSWPELGTLQPGAVQYITKLHESGVIQVVNSCRLSPYDPGGIERDPALVAYEIQRVRDFLDRAGLPFLSLHTLPGKPGADVYTDDKAERYTPGPRGWRRLYERVMLRLGLEPEGV